VKVTSTCLRLNAAVLLLLLAPMIQGTSAFAQTQDQPEQTQSQAQLPVILGIVDFTAVMVESKAGKGLKVQADKLAAAFEADFKKQGKAFNDAQRKLDEQRSTLAKEDLQKKVADLNAQGKKLKDGFDERKKTLDDAFNKARDQIKDALLQIVVDIAKKRGMTLVLNKGDTVLSAEGFDFTDEAMKRLNDKLPSVKMQVGN